MSRSTQLELFAPPASRPVVRIVAPDVVRVIPEALCGSGPCFPEVGGIWQYHDFGARGGCRRCGVPYPEDKSRRQHGVNK